MTSDREIIKNSILHNMYNQWSASSFLSVKISDSQVLFLSIQSKEFVILVISPGTICMHLLCHTRSKHRS